MPDHQKWSEADIPDLTGQVIVVTGANSGVGYAAARLFANNGAQTVLACRNMQKAGDAVDRIRAENPGAAAEAMLLDLASQASVRRFADAFKSRWDRLDVLANNAGIMMVPYGQTEDGYERHFGTNHLGHFALTGLLLEPLLAAPAGRVVTVSSSMHYVGSLDFDNLMYENGRYLDAAAYGRSKLANLLFTFELDRRLQAAGKAAIAVAAHPGGTNTNLQDEIAERWYVRPFIPLMRLFLQSAAMGALPTVRAAVDPDVRGGEYYGPDGLFEQRGYPIRVGTGPAARSRANAVRLWQASERLTGVQYLDPEPG